MTGIRGIGYLGLIDFFIYNLFILLLIHMNIFKTKRKKSLSINYHSLNTDPKSTATYTSQSPDSPYVQNQSYLHTPSPHPYKTYPNTSPSSPSHSYPPNTTHNHFAYLDTVWTFLIWETLSSCFSGGWLFSLLDGIDCWTCGRRWGDGLRRGGR